MLIQCPGCGNRISDKAHACPKCGYIPQKNNAAHAPKSSSRRTGIIISVCSGTILFLALIAIFGMRMWGEKRDQGIAEEIERQLTENTYEREFGITISNWATLQSGMNYRAASH